MHKFLFFLFLASSITYSQDSCEGFFCKEKESKKNKRIVIPETNRYFSESYSSNATLEDFKNALFVLQLYAFEESYGAFGYENMTLRNNVLELRNVLFTQSYLMDYEGIRNASNLNQYILSHAKIGQNQYIYDSAIEIEKIVIDLNYFNKTNQILKSGKYTSLSSENPISITGVKVVGFEDILTEELSKELTFSSAYMNKMLKYLNNMSLFTKANAFQRGSDFRYEGDVIFRLGNDFEIDMFADQSFSDSDGLLKFLSDFYSPLENLFSDFYKKVASDFKNCPVNHNSTGRELYSYWDSGYSNYTDCFYANTMIRFYFSDTLESLENIDEADKVLDEIVSPSFERNLIASQINSEQKIYEISYNFKWSNRLFTDIKIASGGIIDAALLGARGLFSYKLSREEFNLLVQNQLLNQDLVDRTIVNLYFGDVAPNSSNTQLYDMYLEYYPKFKRFFDNPRSIGFKIKFKNGFNTNVLDEMVNNPLLVTYLLNESEVSLLLNEDSSFRRL